MEAMPGMLEIDILLDHIDHVVAVAWIDHVGLGSLGRYIRPASQEPATSLFPEPSRRSTPVASCGMFCKSGRGY